VLLPVSEPAMSSGSAYLEVGYSTFIRAGDFRYVYDYQYLLNPTGFFDKQRRGKKQRAYEPSDLSLNLPLNRLGGTREDRQPFT